MHLFSSMVAYDCKERPCLADIIGHPWLQGEISTPEEVMVEMVKRHEVVKERNTEKEVEKLTDKQLLRALRSKQLN